MDIRCPSCQTLYEFNEERLKRGPVNLKCSQCGHIFRVESRLHSPPNVRRWMLRRHTSGEMLYFKGLNTLQKWIVERKVTRDDEISKTSKKWKRLGDIGELASFFQVADSIPNMHNTPTRQMPTLSRNSAQAPSGGDLTLAVGAPSQAPSASPPSADEEYDELDYFDPLAPGPDQGDVASSASVDWALDAASSDNSAQWVFDGQPEGLPGPALMSSVSSDLAPPPTPQGAYSGPVVIAGTYDDPLEEDPAERSNHFALAMALLLLIVITVVVVASVKPSWLGLQSSPTPQVTQDTNAPTAPSEGDTTDAPSGNGDAPKAQEKAATDAPSKEDGALTAPTAQEQAANTKTQEKAAAKEREKPARKADASKSRRGAREDKAKPTPRGFDGLMDRASAALRGGDGNEALRLYSKAQAQRPSSIPALAGKGRAYMSLGLPQGAVKAYEKALGISPNNGLAMAGLADAYRASGQTQKAIALYKRYLDRYPQGPTAERARRVLSSLGAAP